MPVKTTGEVQETGDAEFQGKEQVCPCLGVACALVYPTATRLSKEKAGQHLQRTGSIRNYQLYTLYSVISKAMFPSVFHDAPVPRYAPLREGFYGHWFGKYCTLHCFFLLPS